MVALALNVHELWTCSPVKKEKGEQGGRKEEEREERREGGEGKDVGGSQGKRKEGRN